MQIAVVDLGIGNLRSVEQALRVVAGDADIVVTAEPSAIESADKVVLPGQGAVGTWFSALRERQLEPVIKASLGAKPVLGICVGMQALFGHCEEDGGMAGLGLFDGSVRHFSHFHHEVSQQINHQSAAKSRLKIPQMGWNQVAQTQDHALWQGITDDSHFYFVHSFCANLNQGHAVDSIAGSVGVYGTADYGHEFIAAMGGDNVFAVQFHPEKSHDDGLKLLKNFTQWGGRA